MSKHRRKKARRNVKPHGCLMCMMGTPKRLNGKRRWPHRDAKRMQSKETSDG